MTKQTLNAIAAFCLAIAATAKTLAESAPDTGTADENTSGLPFATEAPKRPRGRPSGSGNAGNGDGGEGKPAVTGKSVEELRALAQPIITDGQGEAVKKLIVKHGGTKLADIPPENHEAFVKDLQALAY